MKKISLGSQNCFYPSPTILVGTTINGAPNYLNVTYAGNANCSPAMLFISLNKLHYSTSGIKELKTFSVNIPSVEILKETDYCGLVSGKDIDKSAIFHTFYDISGKIPMIEECAINIACEVVQEFELEGSNVLFIGKILESFSEEKYLSNGSPDITKTNPILFSVNDSGYYSVGTNIGKAWDIGKTMIPQ